MRLVAVILCVALFGLNAEAALLHVHKGHRSSDHHHHGPSAHAHQIQVEVPAGAAEVSAADEDGSAIPIVLNKATFSQIHYVSAVTPLVIGTGPPVSSHVPLFVVTSRAHGPPAGRSRSLRAPPASHLL